MLQEQINDLASEVARAVTAIDADTRIVPLLTRVDSLAIQVAEPEQRHQLDALRQKIEQVIQQAEGCHSTAGAQPAHH